MNTKTIVGIAVFAIIFGAIFSSSVSAYSYSTSIFSEKWKYDEDVYGKHKTFTLKHTLDAPRNTCGYYDWSATPVLCGDFYPSVSAIQFAGTEQNQALREAFSTFRQDSKSRDFRDLEKDRYRFRSSSYYGYGSYRSYRINY